jgi:hypothetical protein
VWFQRAVLSEGLVQAFARHELQPDCIRRSVALCKPVLAVVCKKVCGQSGVCAVALRIGRRARKTRQGRTLGCVCTSHPCGRAGVDSWYSGTAANTERVAGCVQVISGATEEPIRGARKTSHQRSRVGASGPDPRPPGGLRSTGPGPPGLPPTAGGSRP